MSAGTGNLALMELVFSTLKFNQQALFNLTVESFAAKDALNAMGPEAVKTYTEAKLKYQQRFASQTSEMLKKMDEVLALLAKAKQDS